MTRYIHPDSRIAKLPKTGGSKIETSEKYDLSFARMGNMHVLIVLYLWLSIVTGALSFNFQHKMREESAGLQREIWQKFQVQGAAGQDTSYSIYRANCTRIFVPACIAIVVRITGCGWDRAFFLFRITSIFIAYVTFYCYNRKWFSPAMSLSATLFMASTIPLTFVNWFEIPTDFVEIITYTLGLWCICDHRDGLLCLVIFVGTFSRETTFFLPFILLMCRIGREPILYVIKTVVLAGLSWLIPLGVLRWWTGLNVQYNHGNSMEHNMNGIQVFIEKINPYNNYLFYIYMFGAFWGLPFVRWHRLPPFLNRAILSIPAFLVVYLLLGGFANEPREIVNLYPLLVPAGIFALAHESRHISGGSTASNYDRS